MSPSTLVDRTAALVQQLRDVAVKADDQGTVETLTDRLNRLARPGMGLVVVGESNLGKSSLVNALVGAAVMPVDFQVSTAVPLRVSYADVSQPTALARTLDGEKEITIAEVAAWATVSGDNLDRSVLSIDIGVVSQLLKPGLEVVDTPGVGGLTDDHARRTMDALSAADAALFVLDAGKPMSGPELDFLERVVARTPAVLFAMNMVDKFSSSHVAKMLANHRKLITDRIPALGDVQILPVSADNAAKARGIDDPRRRAKYRAASGMDDLAARIHQRVVVEGLTVRMREVIRHSGGVIKRYVADCVAGLEPGEEAASQVAAALEGNAPWRTALADAYADLRVEVERLGAGLANQRISHVRQQVPHRPKAAAFSGLIGQELTGLATDLNAIVVGRLPEIARRIADVIELQGFADLLADFAGPSAADKMDVRLSDEAARAIARDFLITSYLGVRAGVQAARFALPVLQAAAASAAASGTAAVAAGAGTGVVVAGAEATAVAAGGGAAGAAISGVAIAAGVVGVLVVAAAVGYAIYRAKTAENAAKVEALAEWAATELSTMPNRTADAVNSNAEVFRGLIVARLEQRRAALNIDAETRATLNARRTELDRIEAGLIELRATVGGGEAR